MTSSYAKGNIYESEVKKILESEGWIVEGQHRSARYLPDFAFKKKFPGQTPPLKLVMQGRDVFGSDIIAKKKSEKTLFIQVSTRENKSHKIKQVMAVDCWNFDHDTVQLWLRTEGKREFEIFQAPTFESVGVKLAVKNV
jgi:Holliday junction resolvase-like predicted endonuclease